VDREQDLAMTADGEGFDRGDPWLLDGLAAELVGRRIVGKRDAAIELVDVAEIAFEIPEKRNPAVIEMRKVDASAEHMPVLVFRMLDRHAAQHRDLDGIVEEGEIDAG